jgi:hypothetical protein
LVPHRLLILLLLVGPWHLVHAGGSIYSANGLGEPLIVGGARIVGLGGGGLALADSHGANFSNPALVALIPRTEARLGGRLAFWSTTSAGETDADAEAGWQAFQLCFPLTPIWKFGLGFVPVRRMDVRTYEWRVYEHQVYEERMRFAGGETVAQILNGFRFSPQLSLGVAVGYAFRRQERWTTIDFSPTDWQDAEFHFDDTWRGWMVTIGALCQPHPRLSFGAVFRPRQQGNWVTRHSYANQDSVAEEEESGSGPGELGAGVAWEFSQRWMAVADGWVGQWKKGDLGPRDDRTPVQPVWFSVGVERLARFGPRLSPWQKWGYRAGLFYRQHYWPEQNGEKAADIGGAVGVSIPVSNRAGAFHLAAEVGQRGSETFGAREIFTRFSLMVEANERWFQRPKPRVPK